MDRLWLGLAGIVMTAGMLHGASAIQITGERRLSFNEGWRFFKGDAPGAERPEFADSQWKQLTLPHDWAIEGPFDPKINPHTGALPISGAGWYRRTFTLPATAKDRFFQIEFDGAMSNARVWLNGHELGGRPYGYIGFAFDLTKDLHFGGQENVLVVRVSPEERSSRWYPGAGIYRNVWLTVTGPVHVAHWGTYVTTPQVTDEKATVAVKTDLQNQSGSEAKVVLQTTIRRRWPREARRRRR
jgi:beta-galactosidase